MTRTTTILTALVLTAGLNACDTYYDRHDSGLAPFSEQSQFAFDDRLPSALEEVYSSCMGNLIEVAPGEVPHDVAGDCESDLGALSTEAATLLLGSALVEAENPSWKGKVTTWLPTDIAPDSDWGRIQVESETALDGFFSSCVITTEIDFEIVGLQYGDADADWHGEGLRVRVEQDESVPFLSGTWDSVASCGLFQQAQQVILNNGVLPQGSYDLFLRDADLDVAMALSPAGAALESALSVSIDASRFDIEPSFSSLFESAACSDEEQPNCISELLDAEGLGAASLAAGVATMFEEVALPQLNDVVADSMSDILPSGHGFCDVRVAAGELLVDTRTTFTGCLP